MSMNTVGRLFASKLPLLIKKARARAVEHPQLFLKGKVTALVQVLITYTNLDAISVPLRFNRERPATLLGVSTRTIDRLLKELETLGWLTRLPQPRLRDGNWGCTSIAWAPWVIKDVFALPTSTDKWGSAQKKALTTNLPKEAKDSCGHRATKKAHLSFSPKGEVLRNKVEDDSFAKTQKTDFDPYNERVKEKRRIPADLVEPMKEFGLTARNICFLMSQCKLKGKRLQEVFAASMTQLKSKKLLGKEVLSWLLYMIGLDRDYGCAARQYHQQVRESERVAKRTALLSRLADKVLQPGTVLPNNTVVASRMDGVVTLHKLNGTIHGGAPEHHLIESLARNNLGWARRVLRGQATSATPNATSGAQETSPAASKANSKARSSMLQSLAQMKSMLRTPPSFARVGVQG